ncbi:MAG: efflux RND transporter periplasmic adaptor subunit [Bacteroidales bacterium]|jgi:membrane fusion protein (multidrug efflux system)|nr:efflux RND transporter periplasmic adaptor subunit [Bacteroidales bacterium]
MNKKTVINAIIILLIGLISSSCKEKTSPQNMENDYKLLEVSLSNQTLSTHYSASIKGRQDIEIRPQVSGLITEILVTEGETVRKGQTLFILEQVAYKAALETAKANVEAAKAKVETEKLTVAAKAELYAEEVISLYDLQTSRNSLKTAEAQLAQAQAQEINAHNDLSYTVIKSPSDGVVGTLTHRVGTLVNSSITTPLTVISDNSDMYVYFSMTENHILSLTRQYGSLNKAIAAMPEVELKLSDGNVYEKKGRIETISGIIDKTTGAVSVRAAFPNENGILLSGGAGNVVFPYEMENVIVIPQAATYELQDKIFVYKVVNGIAESTEIQVFQINDGTTYIVESGLSIGDIIVAEGAGLLRNGIVITSGNE